MRATRRAPAGGGARDGDDVVPEPFAPSRPSLLYLFNCRIGAPMDGSCLRWCVLHALLLMSRPGELGAGRRQRGSACPSEREGARDRGKKEKVALTEWVSGPNLRRFCQLLAAPLPAGTAEGRPSAPSPGGMRRTNPPHLGRNLQSIYRDRADRAGLHSLAYRL